MYAYVNFGPKKVKLSASCIHYEAFKFGRYLASCLSS